MSVELKRSIDALNSAFTEFKAANDDRLKQVETKGTADAALVQKVENLNAALSDLDAVRARIETLENRAERPLMGRGAVVSPELRAHAAAFDRFIRKGVEDGLSDLEIKAEMRTTSDADGGFVVPNEVDTAIQERLVDVSPMRAIADVRTVGPGYSELVNMGGTNSGWVGEEDARPETSTSRLAELKPFWGEIYANPAATQTMLDDAFFSAADFISGEVDLEFALQEGVGCVSGDGVKKMKGFLAYGKANQKDGVRPFQVLQYVATGQAAALPANLDPFIDLVQALNSRLRTGAVWVMNGLTVGGVRKIKDNEGNYRWQPSAQIGQPSTFLGYAVTEMEAMPDVAADAYPAAFGNFKRGYRITDRPFGVRVLRDPYTNKPRIHFYTTKRVGGYMRDDKAIKLLKVAAA